MTLRSTLLLCTLAFASASSSPAFAEASEASDLSAVPIAIMSVGTATVLAASADLTLSAVEASATGTTWVLKRVADGATASVKLSAAAAGTVSQAIGTSVVATTMASGVVLSVAGRAIAFVPNEVGASLLYNERVTR